MFLREILGTVDGDIYENHMKIAKEEFGFMHHLLHIDSILCTHSP